MESYARGKLMLASFLTLVAAGAGFATRTTASGAWERQFDLGGGQFGQILGAGFLGFGMMIFFGGILVEKFGYKRLLVLAFFMHLASGAMLFLASPLYEGWRESDPESATVRVFNLLWLSAFLFSICQGIYEAVINPLIAQLYPEDKTHYLNILHAGWPAGMILGGLFAACFSGMDAWLVTLPWEWVLASFVVFVIAYGVMALPEKFPATVGESASGGLKTVFACFASIPFLVLIVLHAMIGYMELGVDSWMTKLMENFLRNSIIVLVYTSALMFVLRFFAGPIVHRINPIGLLMVSSLIACLGLLWLGADTKSVAMVFAAATFYSFGKAFLWPTMLAVAGERYPQGGAVAMGALGAAGMLTVGLVAGPRIGAQQGEAMSAALKDLSEPTYERYVEPEPIESWGYEFRPVIAKKLGAVKDIEIGPEGTLQGVDSIRDVETLTEEEKTEILAHAETDVPIVQEANLIGSREALTRTAIVPAMMLIGFIGLFIYYRSQGGYKAILLDEEEGEEAPGMGEPAPVEY